MKKIIKILLFLIIILIFLNVTLSRYTDEKSDVSRRLGSKITGGTISISEYARISELYGKYTDALKNGDYETAYDFLSHEYKQYKDYETFLAEISELDFSNVAIHNIVIKTENMYSIEININGEKKENLIVFPPDLTNCFIVPEPFIEYKEINKKFKKRNVDYEIISTTNYLDKFIVDMEITNLDKKDVVSISEFELREDAMLGKKADIETIEIAPMETRSISVQFETNIDFPNKIAVSRIIEDKDIIETYVIDIE